MPAQNQTPQDTEGEDQSSPPGDLRGYLIALVRLNNSIRIYGK